MVVGQAKPLPQRQRAAASKPRKLFIMAIDYSRSDAPGLNLVNETVLRGDRKLVCFEDSQIRGFPDFPEKPFFVFDRKLGLAVRDVELFLYWWLVSDAAKQTFEKIAPRDFQFLECDVRLANGEPGPKRWLCDVVTTTNCIDEEKSSLEKNIDYLGREFYSIYFGAKIILNDNLNPTTHVFRASKLEVNVICDDHARQACKAAGLTGLRYRDVLKL